MSSSVNVLDTPRLTESPQFLRTSSGASSGSSVGSLEVSFAYPPLNPDAADLAKVVLESDRRGDTVRSTTDANGNLLICITPNPSRSASRSASHIGSLWSSPAISRATSATSVQTLYPLDLQFPTTHGLGLKILCLDGGGIRGLSTLEILRNLQSKLLSLGYSNLPPCEIFDIICGTSTGGLIALLLGRMRLTIDECVTLYEKLAKSIFKSLPTSKIARFLKTRARLDSAILEKRIKAVIKDELGSEDAPMASETKHSCKTFVVAVDYKAMDKGIPVLFRTYDTPTAKADTCPVYQAARATSAAPSWFVPQAIYGKRYIDGGVGNNNPALLAIKEAQTIWPNRDVDIIISIGTGTKRNISARNPKRACIGHTTSSHNVHTQMNELYGGPNGNYFRFDVPDIGTTAGLAAWRKMKFIQKETAAYLSTEEVKADVERCAKLFL